jgi:muramoyltetrapeptide carboxypeptidase
VCAPSGPIEDESLDAGLAWLEAQGHPVVVGKHVRARAGYLAGSDDERLADLVALVHDPQVGAILCARGGYGVSRYLARIDPRELRRARKLVCGYSDATHLLCYLQARAGLASLHGPMLERSDVTADARARQLAQMRGEPAGLAPLSGRPLRGGVAEGPLVGGNLKMLHSSVGTPWEPNVDGAILFIEEVSRRRTRSTARSCTCARRAGSRSCRESRSVSSCAASRHATLARPRRTPSARSSPPPCTARSSRLPFGHVADNRALGVGVRARLDGDRGLLTAAAGCGGRRVKRAEVNRRLGKIERAFEKAIDAGSCPAAWCSRAWATSSRSTPRSARRCWCPSGTRRGWTRSTTSRR